MVVISDGATLGEARSGSVWFIMRRSIRHRRQLRNRGWHHQVAYGALPRAHWHTPYSQYILNTSSIQRHLVRSPKRQAELMVMRRVYWSPSSRVWLASGKDSRVGRHRLAVGARGCSKPVAVRIGWVIRRTHYTLSLDKVQFIASRRRAPCDADLS